MCIAGFNSTANCSTPKITTKIQYSIYQPNSWLPANQIREHAFGYGLLVVLIAQCGCVSLAQYEDYDAPQTLDYNMAHAVVHGS
jgi:hypothetical protein